MSLEDKFVILEQLDKGNILVQSRKDETKKIVKQILFRDMNEKEKKKLIDEVNILMEIQSPNIVKYDDYIIDKNKTSIQIISQYCSCGSLEEFINLNRQQQKRMEEKIIWKIFQQVVSAVNQIHNDKQGTILHRDIRPASIFLDRTNIVKLGNFNLIRRLDPTEEFAQTSLPNPYYCSPEQICQGKFTSKTDIWALGCLLYEMATLKAPFKTNSQFQTCRRIKQNDPDPIPTIYSKQLKRVIKWCLRKQCEKRPNIFELVSLPQVNYRIRNKRLIQNKKKCENKERRVMQRQLRIRQLEIQLRQLQKANNSQAKVSEDKQNSGLSLNFIR